MVDTHKAILALYPNVVSVDDTEGAKDKDGNNVAIDMALVNTWVDPEAYKYQRQQEYKPLAEQLERIFSSFTRRSAISLFSSCATGALLALSVMLISQSYLQFFNG